VLVNAPLQQHESLHALASDQLVVEVVARGARITSIKNRLDGREWLAQATGAVTSRPTYGGRFTETDHFGWDEMFPSVDACTYPVEPFAGLDVVDHGELWSVPWETLEASATAIFQRVRSERFAYTFERRLVLDGPRLRANYACVVDETTQADLPLLWALHPQFSMNEGSRVELAGEGVRVLDTSDAGAVKPLEWLGDLVVERDVELGGDRMIYVTPGELISEARIVDHNGSTIRLSWDHSFASYLGVWMDRGRYTGGRVVALEPTNGFFDELARAHHSGTVGSFPSGERVTWWVELKVDQGDGSCANS
jgi:galactose mutarotase-like enzyme